MKCCELLQASYDMLKASGNAAVIMMSSIAGGPTTVNSGAPYAMTKGEFQEFNYLRRMCW